MSIMYSGAGLVASGVGRVSVMCVAGRLLVMAIGILTFSRVAYEFVVYVGRLSGVINCFHEECMW